MVRLGAGGPGRLSRAWWAELPNGNRLTLGIGEFLFEEDNYYFCLTASIPLFSGKHPPSLGITPPPLSDCAALWGWPCPWLQGKDVTQAWPGKVTLLSSGEGLGSNPARVSAPVL